MNRPTFFQTFRNVAGQYTWSKIGGRIIGVPKSSRRANHPVTPLVAVANAQERQRHQELSRHEARATNRLRLATPEVFNIVAATEGRTSSGGVVPGLRHELNEICGL